MNLNEEQIAATQHPLGTPAVLVAGAGSGKTACLKSRVVWLIEQGVPSYRILVVTFTNKAAEEVSHRISQALPHISEASMPKMATIHSLALAEIRKDPIGFGLKDRVTPLDDYDQSQMVRKIVDRTVDVKEKGISLNSYVYGLLEKINYHRSRGVGFMVDYTEAVHEKSLIEHAGYHALDPFDLQIWGLYEENKTIANNIDFADMLCLFTRRAHQDPLWLAKIQKKYDVVIVDEAQDLSLVQWSVVEAFLAPDNPNLMPIGDLGQSIMSFNGSAPHLLKQFSEGWRGHTPTMYRLAKNHRSLPRIIYLANRIQASMTETIPLKMQTFRGGDDNKGTIELTRANTPLDVAMILAREIANNKHKTPYKDNAILVRSARQVMDIETALVRYRVPYVIRGGRGLLQTEEVRDVMAYLRIITNPNDFTALARAVSVPKRGVGDIALEKIRKVANEAYGGNLIKGASSVEKLGLFVQNLENIQQFRDYPAQALEKILIFMDYKAYLKKKYIKEPDKVDSKLENLDRFKDLVRGLSEDQKMSTEDVVFQLTLEKAKEEDKEGQVTISTIHSAKGLEWSNVYVTNLVEGSLPHVFSQTPPEIEEERRLLYVACTRARDSLTLCVPSVEQRGEDYRRVAPSRFLREIGVVKEEE